MVYGCLVALLSALRVSGRGWLCFAGLGASWFSSLGYLLPVLDSCGVGIIWVSYVEFVFSGISL